VRRIGLAPAGPLIALFALAGAFSQSAAAVDVPDEFINETLVSGLSQPTAMAPLPDGRLLVTEQRTGHIRVVLVGADTASAPVFTVPDLNDTGYERGLLGVAVDPEWPVRAHVYLFYTRIGDVSRIVRYRVTGDTANPNSHALQFVEPLYLIDDLPDAFHFHNGGRLRFGPDGCLYASLGDDGSHCASADSTSRRGQLLRLEVRNLPLTGNGQVVAPADLVPTGNPFPSSGPEAALVYAYGFRNPWSFHIDPPLGIVYLADVGDSSNEEINEVFPGDFLGWPWREGTKIRERTDCPEPGFPGANLYKEPIINVPHPASTTAIVMGPMYRAQPSGSANWPAAYQGFYGSLFYAEYYSGWLRMARRQSGVWAPAAAVPGQPNATDWGTGFRAAVDFMLGPDGSVLWLAQFDETFGAGTGHISRIRYVPVVGVPAAAPRAAMLAAAPNPFRAGIEISFTLSTAERVRLEVYDVGGRRLRTLHEGPAAAGTHRHAWDGRDAAGRVLPAGVYLARLQRGEASETLRVLRLR
jgi:glucose/arabinose dehydrogenase